MKRPPKKTDKLEVRLPTETKQAFLARCRVEGRSASEAVRVFIDEHLARSFQPEDLKMIARSPYAYGGLAAAALVAAMVVMTAQPSQAQPDFATVFKSLDRNGDGRLSPQEFPDAPKAQAQTPKPDQGVISIGGGFAELDANRDAAISLAEFTTFNNGVILKRFLALDANSDGRVTLDELQRPGALLGEAAESGMAINGPVARMLAKLDTNHDAAISAAEFGAR